MDQCDAGYFHEQGPEVFESMMRLNYFGTVNAVRAAYGRMVARNSGSICLVSSTLGTMGEGSHGSGRFAHVVRAMRMGAGSQGPWDASQIKQRNLRCMPCSIP